MKGKKNAMANYSGMEAIIVRSSCSLKALMFPFSSELRILMSLHEWGLGRGYQREDTGGARWGMSHP